MPKLSPLPATSTPAARPTETMVVEPTGRSSIVGGGFSEYLQPKPKRIDTPSAINAAYLKASPAEKELIKGFTQANTNCVLGKFWFLCHIRNLDTGRQILCAGCSEEGPGVTLTEFKLAIGRYVEPEPALAKPIAPVVRKPLSSGGRQPKK